MYRSFITCDDPKGVVECGSIRKYRSRSQKMKDKIKSCRVAENSVASLTNKTYKEEKVPKGSTENFCDGQRLNNMIGSWSKDHEYDGRSEDIAKNLLYEALHLQDSLAMLHKLEETSHHTARLKRKQNEKPERDRIDAKMIDRTRANHSSDQCYPVGFQRLQPSAVGSSSDCTEELKQVIKESVVRQSIFPSTTTEELESASEIPSTSSSQSSGVWSDRISDSCFSPTASKLQRGPNLVAKLMGLEEAPSRSFPAVIQKQLEGEKILNQKRHIFQIDMHKVRMNNSVVEKVNPERKPLSETLETMHFKGLLKKGYVEEPKLQAHHFNYPHSKQSDYLPSIVLMKPRCTSYQEFERTRAPVLPEELSPRKLEAEAVPPKTIKHRKGSTNMEKKIEKDVTIRSAKEEGPDFLKEVVKLDITEIKPIENEKSPHLVKLYSRVCHKSHVSETIDKKATVQTISRRNQMKNQRPVAEPEAAKPVAEQIGQRKEEESVDVPCKDGIRIITTLADEPLMGHEADASANKIEEDRKQGKSTSGDNIVMLKYERERDAIPTEEAHDSTNSSELTEHKSLQESQEFDSFLLTCVGNSRLHTSFGGLVEEIYNGIENLKFYSQISGEKLFVDNPCAMMGKDLQCKGLMNGLWDRGWRHGFSANEAELVVNEVENLLLSGLIEEIIINL